MPSSSKNGTLALMMFWHRPDQGCLQGQADLALQHRSSAIPSHKRLEAAGRYLAQHHVQAVAVGSQVKSSAPASGESAYHIKSCCVYKPPEAFKLLKINFSTTCLQVNLCVNTQHHDYSGLAY